LKGGIAERVIEYLPHHLLDGRAHGSPFFGQHCAVARLDPIRKTAKAVVRISGHAKEGIAGELNTEGLQLGRTVLDSHIEIFRVKEIMMSADEVEITVELPVVPAVIAFEPDVKPNDIAMQAMCAIARQAIETRDGVSHADTVEFPGAGITGALGRDEMLLVAHGMGVWGVWKLSTTPTTLS
jgi:hypothetical protein